MYISLVFEKLLLGCSGSFLPTFLESSPSTFFDARPLYLSEGTENCFHLPLIIFLWRKGTWKWKCKRRFIAESRAGTCWHRIDFLHKNRFQTGNVVAEFMRWNKSWFYVCCAAKTLVSWLSSHDREVFPLTDEGGLIPQRLHMQPNNKSNHLNQKST